MEEGNREMLEFMLIVLLADYDLMGLIKNYNRPHDEYAPEARTILRYLETEEYDIYLDELAFKIQYIFEVWFNRQPDIVPCIKLAREIKLMI
jgi:hypothetical protein